MGKLICFDGGKNNESEDTPFLFVKGEKIELGSFVLSGENKQGNRVVYTHDASLDEIIVYSKLLDALCNKAIEEMVNK